MKGLLKGTQGAGPFSLPRTFRNKPAAGPFSKTSTLPLSLGAGPRPTSVQTSAAAAEGSDPSTTRFDAYLSGATAEEGRTNESPRARSPSPRRVALIAGAGGIETEIGVKGAAAGTPEPLGPSPTPTGINFAVYSKNATAMWLCLFTGDNRGPVELPMVKTGEVFHVEAVGCPKSNVLYALRVQGKGGWETGHRWNDKVYLLDPYAPLVAGRRVFGVRDDVELFKPKVGSVFRGTFDFASPAFDWGKDYKRPNVPWERTVIYEMPVRTFTADESSGLEEGVRGSFAGVKAKIPHLKELGVTAVELLPIFEYDELEFQRPPNNPRSHMVNIWGYSHINFFAPMSRFGSNGLGPANAAREFKELVREMHRNGIEVILDVVYNHTAEGGDDDPYLLSFRGIDNTSYYMRNPSAFVQLLNFSGCGNTFNANNPAGRRMIMDSLRQWVEEYHVDGFRFDLASCLCRGEQGEPLAVPPLIREISKDPVLSKVKLIAEPWDIGMYQVGSFPHWDIWAEWNGKYRDDIRKFIKGDAGMKGALATRLSGSADLYNNHQRKPYHSLNFVVAHDGFTLRDLVSYNAKRNQANGENNRDGTNDNFSWNCGFEGATEDANIEALRVRQMKNFMVALLMSQGTPMVLCGDEYGQTRDGNNNWYGHDKRFTYFRWDHLEKAKESGFFRFYSELIKWRVQNPLLGRDKFLTQKDITWHENNWANAESRFLAFTLHDTVGAGTGDIYCAFNAHHFPVDVGLPHPGQGRKWCRLVDTNLPSPRDFTIGGNKGVEGKYTVNAWSSIILLNKPESWVPPTSTPGAANGNGNGNGSAEPSAA